MGNMINTDYVLAFVHLLIVAVYVYNGLNH